MSYQQEVFNVISSFTGHNANYVIPKEFMRLLKDSNSALILSQLVYWTGRQADPDGWIYKSYAEWEAEIFLSKKSIMTAIKRLKKFDLIETQVRKIRLDNGMMGDTCVHYLIKQENLANLITNQLKSLGSAERELREMPKGNFPECRKGTSLPINTKITNKNYDDVPAPQENGPLQDPEPGKTSSSSRSENEIIKTLAVLFALVPEHLLKSSVKKTIEKALTSHSADYIRSAIEYTNDHSNGDSWQKYRAYLDKAINYGYADGYQSDSKQAVDHQAMAKEFAKMSDDILEMLADAGNQFAIDELALRK